MEEIINLSTLISIQWVLVCIFSAAEETRRAIKMQFTYTFGATPFGLGFFLTLEPADGDDDQW
jgi:hypothetical protein